VGDFAVRLGELLEIPEADLETLRDASLLHDIGKIGISDSILHKPGPLSDQEYEIMKRHPVIGENIVKPLKTFSRLLNPIRHHHELLDGSGYPDGLAGEKIPLVTRIMVVSDIFDALTSDRPYRPSMDIEEAMGILRKMSAEGKVDAEVVKALDSVSMDWGRRQLDAAV
jgi:putative two-component system response regulator